MESESQERGGRILPLAGKDHQPIPWEEALLLARTVKEVEAVSKSRDDGTLNELLAEWREREKRDS